jgi:hypothetical protein
LGVAHRIVLRKDAEAKLEAQLTVARLNASTSQANVKRRQQLGDDFDALRTRTKWIVL